MLSLQTLCFLPLNVLHTFLELEKENKSKWFACIDFELWKLDTEAVDHLIWLLQMCSGTSSKQDLPE